MDENPTCELQDPWARWRLCHILRLGKRSPGWSTSPLEAHKISSFKSKIKKAQTQDRETLTCACKDQFQLQKNADCNQDRGSPTPPHWTGLLEIGTLTATLNCKFKVVAVKRNIPTKFQYLVEDGCSFPAFGIWQVHTYFPPGTFTPCSSSACRWVEALLVSHFFTSVPSHFCKNTWPLWLSFSPEFFSILKIGTWRSCTIAGYPSRPSAGVLNMHHAQPRPISLDFLGMEVFAGFLADWLDFLISEELIL